MFTPVSLIGLITYIGKPLNEKQMAPSQDGASKPQSIHNYHAINTGSTFIVCHYCNHSFRSGICKLVWTASHCCLTLFECLHLSQMEEVGHLIRYLYPLTTAFIVGRLLHNAAAFYFSELFSSSTSIHSMLSPCPEWLTDSFVLVIL